MSRKSKKEKREELVDKILAYNQAKRKTCKLDPNGQYVLRKAWYDWSDAAIGEGDDDEPTRVAPEMPKVGDVLTPKLLRSLKSLKCKISNVEKGYIDNYDEDTDGDIPLVDEHTNNFIDSLAIEVEVKVKRVYKAATLEEIEIHPEIKEESTESWDT